MTYPSNHKISEYIAISASSAAPYASKRNLSEHKSSCKVYSSLSFLSVPVHTSSFHLCPWWGREESDRG